MPEIRRKYDAEFREGAVTIVRETGRSIAEAARELGIGAGTLGSWVKKDRLARGEEADRARLDPGYVRRLERENAELRMERDVLKRSVVLWVNEAERHEALLDRAVMKGHRRVSVAAGALKLRAARSLGRGRGRKAALQRRGGPAPSDGSGPASKTERCT